mgnify:CR=1 FL=1
MILTNQEMLKVNGGGMLTSIIINFKISRIASKLTAMLKKQISK